MDRAATLAGAQLEDRSSAVTAQLVPGEMHVGPGRREAGERPLRGAQEQVVPGRQRGRAVRPSHRAGDGHQGDEPLPPTRVIREHACRQCVEGLGSVTQQSLEPNEAVLVGQGRARIRRREAVAACQGQNLGVGGRALCQSEVVLGGQRTPERPWRNLEALGGDQVLSRRVIGHPLEGHSEETRGELGDRRRVSISAHCGRGGDALQRPVRCHAIAQATHEHGDLGALGSVVDVGLVDHQKAPGRVTVAREQAHVLRAEQQVLQHRVVGQQQVGRRLAHLLAAEQLVAKEAFAGVELLETVPCPARVVLGVAGVPAEGDVRGVGEDRPKPLHLVIGQGIHRVQQQRPHARTQGAPLVFSGQAVEDRHEE